MAISPGDPPKKFCDSQVRKVVETTLTFGPQDSRRWRDCAAAFVDEACARRYLVATDWMASRAVMAITETIRWRLDLGLGPAADSACSGECRWTHCCRGLCGDKAKPIRVSSVKDAKGRPLVVFSVRRWPKGDQDWLRMVIDALEEASIQLQRERRQSRHHRHDHHADGGQKGSCDLRRGEEEIKAEGGEEGETEDTYAWLVDMGGAGPGDAPGLRTLQTLDDILAVHYPGKLGRVLIVNASVFLRVSIAVAERLVEEKTRSKMVLIADGWQKSDVQLRRYIPAGDLRAVLAENGVDKENESGRSGKKSQESKQRAVRW
ncbi:unnamed protein product [Pylaiella littoralis]